MPEYLIKAIAALHFQYSEQFLVALLPMSLTVVIHGQGMSLAMRYWKRFRPHQHRASRSSQGVMVLVAIVGIMLAAHFIETVVWASLYFLTGMLTDPRAAMSLSVNSYTTLGASHATLPQRWQGLQGIEAMTAMLMFGWSTAVLAAVVQKLYLVDD
jgi:hypothetical protein